MSDVLVAADSSVVLGAGELHESNGSALQRVAELREDAAEPLPWAHRSNSSAVAVDHLDDHVEALRRNPR